jgi:hypothetical protein
MVGWLHYLELEVRLNILVVGMCGGGGCSPHSNQEAAIESIVSFLPFPLYSIPASSLWGCAPHIQGESFPLT